MKETPITEFDEWNSEQNDDSVDAVSVLDDFVELHRSHDDGC